MDPKRILVAEDEGIVAIDLQRTLEELGYVVADVASSGREAVEMALRLSPDLVLMDIRLQGEADGIAAADEIRNLCGIPVVYLTAHMDHETLCRAKLTEPCGYVLKPFRPRELSVTLEMAFYKHEMERRLRKNERWFVNALGSVEDAVIATDTEGRVRFVNPPATLLTGWKEEEALDEELHTVFRILEDDKRGGGAGGQPRDAAVLVARDGGTTLIDYTRSSIEDAEDGHEGVIVVFRDVSAQRRAAAEVRRRMVHLEALNAVIAAAATTSDLDALLRVTLNEAQRAVGASMGVAGLWGREGGSGGQLTLLHVERGVSASLTDAILRSLYATSPRPEPVVLDNCGNPRWGDEALRAEMCRLNVGACLIAPVMGQKRCLGTLVLALPSQHAWSRDEVALVEAMARQIAGAAERLRLFEQVRSHAQRLSTALTRLAEVDRLKSEFMQNVSHELRTPLALILGYAQLLHDGDLGELNADQEGAMGVICSRADLLENIVEDITLILEIEARPARPEPVALLPIARSALDKVRGAAAQGGLTLCHEMPEDLPLVGSRAPYLQRVLDNLLSNAVKFTPRGGRVTVRGRHEEGQVVVEVEDTGIGIPTEQQERIFDRFYQVDGSARRRYGGVGMGLAVVKEVVEAFGGRVGVSSQVNQGSTFTVSLPVATVSEPAIANLRTTS
jgi:PAS domain S-box-containing protein